MKNFSYAIKKAFTNTLLCIIIGFGLWFLTISSFFPVSGFSSSAFIISIFTIFLTFFIIFYTNNRWSSKLLLFFYNILILIVSYLVVFRIFVLFAEPWSDTVSYFKFTLSISAYLPVFLIMSIIILRKPKIPLQNKG